MIPSNWIVADFETYYDDAYSLRKMSAMEYILDDRFEAQCLSYICPALGATTPRTVTFKDLPAFMDVLRKAAHGLTLVGANSSGFDALIFAWHYDIHFKEHIDTVVLSRYHFGSTQVKHSLEAVAARLDLRIPEAIRAKVYALLGVKDEGDDRKISKALEAVKGLRNHEIPPHLYEAECIYCEGDVYLTALAALKLPVPESTTALMTLHTEALTRLPLRLDRELLSTIKDDFVAERDAELTALFNALPFEWQTAAYAGHKRKKSEPPPTAATVMHKHIRSKDKFADLLRFLGVADSDIPRKPSTGKTTAGNMVYAFAKTDLDLVVMAENYGVMGTESPDSLYELVPLAVDMRLKYQSTSMESKLTNYLRVAAATPDSRWGMHINVHGATNTGRMSGGNASANSAQNLKRAIDPIPLSCGVNLRVMEDVGVRDAIMSPEDRVMIVYDSSGIELRCVGYITQEASITDALSDASRDLYCEFAADVFKRPVTKSKADKKFRFVGKVACLAEDTEVLTARGWVALLDVKDTDLLWDGEEWVPHGGVVYMGDRDIINVNGLGVTADHLMEDANGWKAAGDCDPVQVERFALRNLPDSQCT